MTSPHDPSANGGKASFMGPTPAADLAQTPGAGARGLKGEFNRSAFNFLVLKARAAEFWERLYPATILPVNAALIFLSVSWFGAWALLPAAGRMAGVALLAGALGAAFAPLSRMAFPTRKDAVRRIDRQSGLPHSPASTLDDRLASKDQEKDPVANAIWQHHLNRIGDLSQLKAGTPKPDVKPYPAYQWRIALAMVAAFSFFAAGDDKIAPIQKAFDWSTPVAPPATASVDAWVTPPSYIEEAPIFLTDAQDAEVLATSTITTSEGGILTIRITGGDADVSVAEGPGQFEVIESEGSATKEPFTEYRMRLTSDTAIEVKTVEFQRVWTFAVTPDNAPDINIAAPPMRGENGELLIPFIISDDHGTPRGEAMFQLPQAPAPIIPRRTFN